MQLGMHLRELWGLKRGVALSTLLAAVLALSSVYHLGLLPPRLQSRSLSIGTASTALIIDSPRSQLTDVGAAADTPTLALRATLLGNVMSSEPIRAEISHLMAATPNQVAGTTRNTENVPRVLIEPGSGSNASDILSSPDHYRLEIQADPSVPVLRVYTQAPSQQGAVKLANAAVTALRDYTSGLAAQQHVPPSDRLRLIQLGAATGGIANPGADVEIGLLVFVGVFGIACCALLFISRTHRGWQMAKLAEQGQL
jgi:hypothetical protein